MADRIVIAHRLVVCSRSKAHLSTLQSYLYRVSVELVKGMSPSDLTAQGLRTPGALIPCDTQPAENQSRQGKSTEGEEEADQEVTLRPSCRRCGSGCRPVARTFTITTLRASRYSSENRRNEPPPYIPVAPYFCESNHGTSFQICDLLDDSRDSCLRGRLFGCGK